MGELVAFGVLMIAVIGLFFAWGHWRDQFHAGQQSDWRQLAINIALFGVTLQAALFVAVWTPLSRHHPLAVSLMRADFLLALATIPCAFAWRGRARWLLLASAICLPFVCLISVLAELAY